MPYVGKQERKSAGRICGIYTLVGKPGYVLSSLLPKYTVYNRLSFEKLRVH